MSNTRLMFNMTVREMRIGLREMQTVIVPLGVVEQHGYHLPLGTDSLHAERIAEEVSAKVGCFVAPTLHYSFSGGMLPGTINLSPQVFSLVIMDICSSLAAQGFRNIVLLQGHGGTECSKAVQDAADMFLRLRTETNGVTVAVVPFWELSPTFMQCFAEGDYHAGKYETSLVLHWHPELVKMDQARLDEPEMAERLRSDPNSFLSGVRLVDSQFVVPKLIQTPEMHVGVMGDYEGASSEIGSRVAEEAVTGLAALVDQLEYRSSSDLEP